MATSTKTLSLRGEVTSGMGEAQDFLSLSGYTKQFRELLGYTPYPGTLNIRLTEESVRQRSELEMLEPIVIESWEDDGQVFGGAHCYPAVLIDGHWIVDRVHVIVPDRTDHDDEELEILAENNLREEHGLRDGDPVRIVVERPKK